MIREALLVSCYPTESEKLSNTSEFVAQKIYDEVVVPMYEKIMFSTASYWLGYNATFGVTVEGINLFEPSLQKALSQIHLTKDNPEQFLRLCKNFVSAWERFDYKKEIIKDYQEDFIQSGAQLLINELLLGIKNILK